MNLPQAARSKAVSDGEIASLGKHCVYELVLITADLAGRRVMGTWWVNKIKADGTYKSHLVVQGWSQLPEMDGSGTFAPIYMQISEHPHDAGDRSGN